ncbi:unnamed protein product [Cylicocyclus nassatus]|uniref:Uncharacterized protein n=1 Tax=Cylicocyclus nassatus TaxID=53992 RepID=A0AA36GXP0_CYLNA|nr:unnamed protein product [Cylicocyclus nassatus]CAJ0596289.1 unnamed protein product [Cylicocyclus nassatus]CAJ0600295.1 unnamed protein product [Cylicocyclus nassatus]
MHSFPACSLQEDQQSPQASKHVRVRTHAQTRENIAQKNRAGLSRLPHSQARYGKSAKSVHFTRFAFKLYVPLLMRRKGKFTA